jgi:hypothetical protein
MTKVAEAARWLRSALDGAEWLPRTTVFAMGKAAGHERWAIERARVRAGIAYRRIGRVSEWRIAEPATWKYRNDPERRIDPPPGSHHVDVIAYCSVCARSAVLPRHRVGGSCLDPSCPGTYQSDGMLPDPYSGAVVVTEDVEDAPAAQDDVAPDQHGPRAVHYWTWAACPSCRFRQEVVPPGKCVRWPTCSGLFRIAESP